MLGVDCVDVGCGEGWHDCGVRRFVLKDLFLSGMVEL